MQVPYKNIFAHKNVKHQNVLEIFDHAKRTIIAKTRSLKPTTGIFDPSKIFNQGVEWLRLREYAMKDDTSQEFAIVSTFLV